jgi:transcriptional regulator with GAF, ATPase, and Fis domain
MSENRLLSPADLNLDKRNKIRTQRTLEEARALADRESIMSSMYLADSNISRAAELLGITRVSLHRLIKKYQLECGSTTCSSCADRDKCFWVTPEGQSEARNIALTG